MKQPDVGKAWLDAGIALGKDPTLHVPCPVCGEANLAVQDVYVEGSNSSERILRCPSCGSRIALLVTKKPAAQG